MTTFTNEEIFQNREDLLDLVTYLNNKDKISMRSWTTHQQCGTAYCIAGAMATLPNFKKIGYSTAGGCPYLRDNILRKTGNPIEFLGTTNAAASGAVFLGIEPVDAEKLFGLGRVCNHFYPDVEYLDEIDGDMAVKALEMVLHSRTINIY